MTIEQREELKKKFDHFVCFKWNCEHAALINNAACDQLFDFFYSEIEARDKEIDALNDDVRGYRNGHELNSKRYIEALSKLQRLEEIIKAADEVIKCYPKKGLSEKYGYDYEQALEHYNKLKSKLPSGI